MAKKLNARNSPVLARVKRQYNHHIYKAFVSVANHNDVNVALDWLVNRYVREEYRAKVRAALTSADEGEGA